MNRIFRRLAVVCAVTASFFLSASLIYAKELPDQFTIYEGRQLTFSSLPVSSSQGTVVQADAAAGHLGTYHSDLKLFGVVEIKKVSVSVVQPQNVIAGGGVFGIKLFTQGVMVVGMSDIDTPGGPKNPAYEAGIRKGDIILAVDGQSVNSNAQLAAVLSKSHGGKVSVSLRRNNTGYVMSVKPQYSVSEKEYKAGIWVRDSTAGIGTITYYDPQTGIFAGLGHGICDVATGEILPLLSGEAVRADILNISKGSRGHTGEIEGMLEDESLGTLSLNRQTGVYGELNVPLSGREVPVALCQDVRRGAAQIIASIDDTGPHSYQIEIEKVDYNALSPTKNMVLRITDKTLLAKTGGIVQGMSGSPILQNGRLVGAVTHVFVNDPTKGYGIFAENMINTEKNLVNG